MTAPLGKYKLVKLIAAGGMAEVYLARQAGAAGFEKLVCLKRILPHLARDKQFVDMFLNEARLAARLDHPNIVSIFDLGEANGNYFIAMEFIDGPSLRAVAKKASELGELLPIAEILKIVSMAAAGLEYAHNLHDQSGQPLGLVHRDISPDNVLVHKNGSAKVVDFGIAKAANSSSATRTGTLKGKVAYMPPEQLRGEPLDRRTDVFALGVCLYELLAGKRPWEGNSEVALIGKIMTEEPQPLAALRPDAPAHVVTLIEKALAKDREQRYQSCAELQAELESALVQMQQSVTPSRIADFVKLYSPEPAPASEATDPHVMQVEAELSGTAAIPQTTATRGDGTLLLDNPVPPAKSGRPLLVGLGAFLGIVVLGGGAGYFALFGKKAEEPAPVVVERASVVEPPKPAPAPAPAPEPAKPVEAAKPAEEPKPAPAPPPKKVAVAVPAPQPVVVIKEAPKPPEAPKPAPVVMAKGELVLLIRPWAKVEVDGREVGVTPLSEKLMLGAGDHQVKLSNPELGKEVVRTVHITAGEQEQLKEILDE